MVTGARVKIGYQAAILLLRAGAKVICVTRFPIDAAARYAREEDFSQWGHRLEIHGVDLRHTPSVEALCAQICDQHERLDFLINNACQTVRRPPAFYRHMMDKELAASPESSVRALVASQRSAVPRSSAELSQVPLVADDFLDPRALFPAERLDADLQQVDLRQVNSWRLKLHEVPTIELLEGPPRQRRRALRPQRPAQAPDAGRADRGQAHRQRQRDGGAILPHAQERSAPATPTWPRPRST